MYPTGKLVPLGAVGPIRGFEGKKFDCFLADAEGTPRGGWIQKVGSDDVYVWALPTGRYDQPGTCVRTTSVHINQGSGSFLVDGIIHLYRPGSTFIIAKEVQHGFRTVITPTTFFRRLVT